MKKGSNYKNSSLKLFNLHTLRDSVKIYEKPIDKVLAEKLVSENFKLLNGNCFYTVDGKLLISVFRDDSNIYSFVDENGFSIKELDY